MKHYIRLLFISIVLLLPSLAQAEYLIGPGDGLSISIWGSSDLDTIVRVRPDGIITLKGVGELKAEGNTSQQLQQTLTDKYAKLVRNPVVTVAVVECVNNTVIVHGPGVTPQVIPLVRYTSLLQLLSHVSPSDFADLENAYLMRDGEKIVSDLDALFRDGKTTADVRLQPNDRIYIPYRANRFVFVLGAVNQPRAIPHREGITVMEAILEAGGFTKFADQNKTAIVRGSGEARKNIPVMAEEIIQKGDLAQNVELTPGDYVIAKASMF